LKKPTRRLPRESVLDDICDVTTEGKKPLVSLSAVALALDDVLKWVGLELCKDGRTGGLQPLCK